MKQSISVLATVAALALAGGLKAETMEETAAIFGAPPLVLDISLSPSGNKIAYLSGSGHSTETLYIVDLAAGDGTPKAILTHPDPESELAYCYWANEERLACQVHFIKRDTGNLLSFTRMFALNDEGGDVVMLSSEDSRNATGIQQFGGTVLALDLAGKPDKILMTRDWVPEYSTGTRVSQTDAGLGVEEVDVTDGKRRRIEAPDPFIASYTADERGRVRLKVRQTYDTGGYLRTSRTYLYRDAESDRWRDLLVGGKEGAGPDFYPATVDAAKNVSYGFVTIDGHDAAASLTLDGAGKLDVLLHRADVDVDDFITIGRQRRVVGASYATEKREVAYFDPALAKLAADFRKALPGQPLIDIVGSSADEKRLVLIASSDTDPGMIYLYEKDSRQLSELMPVRRGMDGRTMGAMQPVTFPAADGTQIPGYLTLPPGSDGKGLPAIVLPHGGPSARDEWGFDWLVQFFAARGYAVLQPNYRGSAGYGSDWFGRNGYQAWRTAVSDVNDAGKWLVAQGIAKPEQLAIVGWSYGGYAALQSQVLDNSLFKAVVAIAPVTDLERLRESSRAYTNFRLVSEMIGNGPHVSEGSPARNAERFAAPVLLFHGTLDQNVDVSQSQLMRDRLQSAGKQVQYVEYDDRDHYIDDVWARTNMLMDIDRFLARTLVR